MTASPPAALTRAGSRFSLDAPFLGAVALLLVVLGGIVWRTIVVCGGHFGYPLDDTYIHMAVAKNFSQHGVWGTTRYGFTSVTSSPLFSFLLSAAYWLTGVHEPTPLVLNVVAAVALLWWCNYILERNGLTGPVLRFILLAALTVAVPLPSLTFVGMEHVLHTLLILIFAHLGARVVLAPQIRSGLWIALLASAAAVVVTRYESIFLIGLTGVLLLLRRRWSATFALALATLAPLAIYGAISLAHGWYAVPNSLLIKANLPAAHSLGLFPAFLHGLSINFTQGGHVTLLLLATAILIPVSIRRNKTIWTYSTVQLLLFFSTGTMHLLFARVGWFFRYESYLVGFGMIAVAVCLSSFDWRLSGFGTTAYVFLGLFCLFAAYRAERAVYRAPQAASDIYNQQYVMGEFTRTYLNDQTLVLNDIGAVSFLSDARILDTIGLGDMAPTVARRNNSYSLEWLNSWARQKGAAVAILYPQYAAPEWPRVATWTIPGNYMSGSDVVGIYAVSPRFEGTLRKDLADFTPHLPPRVVQR